MNANKKTAPVIFNDQALRFKNQDNLIASPILFQTVNTFKLEYFHDIFKLLDCIKKNESLLKIIKDIEQKSKSIQEYD